MTKSNTTVLSSMTSEACSRIDLEDETLLAAAVAAALAEYRRQVQQQNGHDGSESVRAQWRMLACWERLRGNA